MGERVITDEQLEELVEAELAKRRKVVEEVIAALQPVLDGIRTEVASANHIKRTLGRQLSRLESQVKQTNAELGRHVVLAAHPGTAETIDRMNDALERGEHMAEQFGIEKLSLEQKQALPVLLKSAVDEQLDRKKGDRRATRRAGILTLVATIVASISGAIVAVAAILSLIANGTVQVGVHH